MADGQRTVAVRLAPRLGRHEEMARDVAHSPQNAGIVDAPRLDLGCDIITAISDDALEHADAVFEFLDPAGILRSLFSAAFCSRLDPDLL